ncbi:hypothetical protein [Thermomonospora catenispora]|uniref:hypothetical protein n=1 Tax=Thermomonospora catenispora TaxID=2493090 RepID=UPI001121A1F2|nr:hypothetical protein [Thermomonospora catenispora]TNY34543.1 hypothetical protein EIO00_23290 [Thermomonospora catenispora]
MSVRDGYYAGWRGLEYEASPDGDRIRLYTGVAAEGFTEVVPGRHVRVVPRREVDHLCYVTTWCTWRGEPFQVLGEQNGWLRVEYAGSDPEAPRRLGLEAFDVDVHQGWVRRGEVSDLREERW